MKSEKKYECNPIEGFVSILDSMETIIYVADLKTYEILYANKFTNEYFGELTGKTCWKSFHEGMSEPCTFCSNNKLFNEKGEPAGIYTLEYKNSKTEKIYSVRDRAVKWHDGRYVRLSVQYDITRRRKAENKIENERNLLRTLIDNLPETICIKDKDSKFLLCNKLMVEVYSRSLNRKDLMMSDLIGKSDIELLSKDKGENFVNEEQDIILTKEPVIDKEISNDEKTLFGLYTKVPFYSSDGEVQGLVCASRDITRQKLTESTLRESEERHKALSDATFEAVFISENGICIETNQAAVEMFGYSYKDLIGIFGTDVIAPESKETVLKNMLSGYEDSYEAVAVKKDGTLFPVEIRGKMYNYKGKKVRATAIREFTVRKQAETALRESDNMLQSVIQATQEAMICINEMGNITIFNSAAELIFGYKKEQMIGCTLDSILPEQYRKNHSEYVKSYFKTEKPDGVIGKTVELQAVNSSGSLFPIEISLSCGEINNNKFVIAVLRDITERNKVEEALRENEEKFRSVIETANDAIVSIDAEGVFIFWNKSAEKIFGYSEKEILGKSISLIIPERYQDIHKNGMKRLKKEGKSGIIGETEEVTGLRKDGKEIPLELSMAGWKTSNGNFYTSIIRDITDRKQFEEELKKYREHLEELVEERTNEMAQANKKLHEEIQFRKQTQEELKKAKETAEEASRVKSEFLANMSHEIRTPMNGIIGMTSLLLESDLTDLQRKNMGIIRSSGESLLSVINSILDLSKIESGKIELEEVSFNLQNLAEETVNQLKPDADAKDNKISLKYEADNLTDFKGDPGRVRQIVANFLSNAIKFTSKGNININISLLKRERGNARICLQFEDTGLGIKEDHIEKIFESFTQADPSTTRKFGGTGLGLPICKQLAKMMSGSVEVESIYGKGSKFKAYINLKIDKQKADKESSAIKFEEIKILIVDDSAAFGNSLKNVFKRHGIESGLSKSGTEAFKELKDSALSGNPYQIVLIDYWMPKMNGSELASEIKKDPLISDTVLVLITGSDKKFDEDELFKNGFSAFVTKPFDTSDLFSILIEVWGNKITNTASKLITLTKTQEDSSILNERIRPDSMYNCHILLVEDNSVNQQVAVQMLNSFGCRVDVAGNGLEAFNMVEMIPYDLIFMDCQMPEMDGLEASKEIRRIEDKNRHTPIIAMTAKALKGDREACLNAGMDDYLSKPVKLGDIENILFKWIPDKNIKNVFNLNPEIQNENVSILSKSSSINRETIEELLKLTEQAGVSFFVTLVESFKQDGRNYIKNMKTALEEKNINNLKAVSHSLAGTSGNMGALKVYDVCKKIENISILKSFDGVDTLLSGLDNEFHSSVSELETEVKKLLSKKEKPLI